MESLHWNNVLVYRHINTRLQAVFSIRGDIQARGNFHKLISLLTGVSYVHGSINLTMILWGLHTNPQVVPTQTLVETSRASLTVRFS